MMNTDLLKQIYEKYQAKNQDPETFLKGVIHNKPVNYWEYVEVNTLLSLQKTRTGFKDEFIFIVYHQITELVLRLIIHELEQLTDPDAQVDDSVFAEKVGRIDRYTDLLINSFSIMNKGMDYEQYNQFRLSLAPASGFQSAQFRLLELYCTSIDNLINERGKALMPEECTLEDKFNYVYWQEAGLDRTTGKKSVTLLEFEKEYLPRFIQCAHKLETHNLYQRSIKLEQTGKLSPELKEALRKLDHKFNVAWPKVHLETAHTYLGQKGQPIAATGGSHWVKYLHPKYQRRIFFPNLWTDEELENWGE